jgi:hypothetical protein
MMVATAKQNTGKCHYDRLQQTMNSLKLNSVVTGNNLKAYHVPHVVKKKAF